MKSSKPVSAETAAVNKEPEVTDLNRLREGRGLTLKDIFSATRITVTNLEAIEAGHYHLLPEPVYARTFIKTYAGILETDSEPLLQQYENYLNSLDKTHDALEGEHKELLRKEKEPHNIRFSLWIIAAVVLSGLIVLIVLVDVNDVVDLFSARQTSSQKTVSSPIPATAPAPTPEPNVPVAAPAGSPPSVVTQPGQTPANQGASVQKQGQAFNLKIEAVEKTWIRISADQKQAEQMILSKGERIERTARESFIIDAGNAGGVLMSFQDKPLPSLGKRGEVVHLKLP
ncbi:MAG: RodZ domain-containing protein [Syntrophales bacterium]|jgi:cytoskeletal protein RodZ